MTPSTSAMRVLAAFVRALIFVAMMGVSVAQGEEFAVPAGYRAYVLEPLDGRVAVPEGWTARHGSREDSLTWVFMKDPQPDGSYGTGMAIQFFVDIKKRTGMSPAMSAFDLIDTIKKRGTVLSECSRSEQEHFYRHCLEMLEEKLFKGAPTKMHVLYTIMPAKTFGMLVTTMYGAPEAEWQEQGAVIRVMADFRIIGSGLGR